MLTFFLVILFTRSPLGLFFVAASLLCDRLAILGYLGHRMTVSRNMVREVPLVGRARCHFSHGPLLENKLRHIMSGRYQSLKSFFVRHYPLDAVLGHYRLLGLQPLRCFRARQDFRHAVLDETPRRAAADTRQLVQAQPFLPSIFRTNNAPSRAFDLPRRLLFVLV